MLRLSILVCGNAERNLGHYSSAHENLKQYLNASGEKAEHRDAARKELRNVEFYSTTIGADQIQSYLKRRN